MSRIESEVLQTMAQFERRKKDALEKIAGIARPLVATLKDHQLDHTAAELSSALFELDVVHEEFIKFIESDPPRILAELFKAMGGHI